MVVLLLEEDEEIIVSSLFGLVSFFRLDTIDTFGRECIDVSFSSGTLGRLSAANATVSKPFPNTTLWKALKSKGLC